MLGSSAFITAITIDAQSLVASSILRHADISLRARFSLIAMAPFPTRGAPAASCDYMNSEVIYYRAFGRRDANRSASGLRRRRMTMAAGFNFPRQGLLSHVRVIAGNKLHEADFRFDTLRQMPPLSPVASYSAMPPMKPLHAIKRQHFLALLPAVRP